MPKQITMNFFYDELRKKVTAGNAKLLVHSAMVSSGVAIAPDQEMKKEEVQNFCLALINNGGPGFHVGKDVYSQTTR